MLSGEGGRRRGVNVNHLGRREDFYDSYERFIVESGDCGRNDVLRDRSCRG